MSKPDLMGLAQQERAALLDLLRDLSDDQWDQPSLCSGWTVRDVAVHVVSYDELSTTALARTMVAGGLSPTRANDVALRRYAELEPDQVVDLVARCQTPRGLTAGLGGGIAVTDGTIHHQDIRRALRLPRQIPEEQLVAVLDFSLKAPTLPARANAKGLRLVATDLDWSHGSGAEVTGPGEALLMTIAGRAHALGDLSGEGLDTLRARLT
ncbi:maleylpyruvate isomerase family mycothiol-dependent enzyme [Solicola sp. PLA-1-18]|uniref:maleylpyruvate isomerase family mycothiol-dependent enzyme n=1 Tax=Solicola sp. PLA-1-18 TaxID=3380532 RepID=UPI003B77D0A5